MEIRRYKDLNIPFAEDLGTDNPEFEYTGTEIVDSPYGLARRFDGISDHIIKGDPIYDINVSNSFSISLKINVRDNEIILV